MTAGGGIIFRSVAAMLDCGLMYLNSSALYEAQYGTPGTVP